MAGDFGLDLRFIVIKLLSKSPMHGYMIAAEVEKFFGRKPSNGALNPLFTKLEDEGLVDSFETVEHGKYKKIYSLSDQGKSLLSNASNVLLEFIKH
ncbi:MAG: PadR family transcriptional regulator [Candidatus Nanoarchaeia archaeon]|jgi:DNA-binding PadR family transcriptional regulator